MENENIKPQEPGKNPPNPERNDREFPPSMRKHGVVGLIIILVGITLLLGRLPQTERFFPDWFWSWPTILIGIGLAVGIRDRFHRGPGWFILIVIGTFFVLRNTGVIGNNTDIYLLPVALILIGLFVVFSRNRADSRCRRAMFFEKMQARGAHFDKNNMQGHSSFGDTGATAAQTSGEDYVNISSIFGGSRKTLFSKSFKGGVVNCVFGGGEIDLTQADIEENAVLDIFVAFGGTKIYVPVNWNIRNELSPIMGGVDDKRRATAASMVDFSKTLILRGNVFFGGVEIKN